MPLIREWDRAEGPQASYILNAPDDTLQGITASADAGILHLSKDNSADAAWTVELTFGMEFGGATVEDGEFVLDLVRTSGADPTGGTALTIAKTDTADGTSVIDFAVVNKAGLTGGTFGASLATVTCAAIQGRAQQRTLYLHGDELKLAANEGLALVMRTNGDAGLNGWFTMRWVEA